MKATRTPATTIVFLTVVAGLSGCTAVLKNTDMESMFVEHFVPEEQDVQVACALLPAESVNNWKNLKEILKAPESLIEAGRKEVTKIGDTLRSEILSNYEALLSSLGVSRDACDPRAILNRALSEDDLSKVPDQCLTAIDAVLNGVARSDEPISRLVEALRRANLRSALDLIRDPIKVARLIDLSPALLSAALALTQGAEELIDEITNDIPLIRGLVRAGVRALAAEVVAWLYDAVIAKLEEEKIVNPASVARTACALHGKGIVYGALSRRILTRSILRFSAADTYRMEELCAEMDQKGDGVCEKLKAAVQTPAEMLENAGLRPNLSVSEVDRRVCARGDWGACTAETAKETAKALQSAMPMCGMNRPDGICTMESLSMVASVLHFHEVDSSIDLQVVAEHLHSIDRTLGVIDARLRDVDSKLGSLELRQYSLEDAERQIGQRLDQTNSQLMLMTQLLVERYACQDAMALVRKARLEFANSLFGCTMDASNAVPTDVCHALNERATTYKDKVAEWCDLKPYVFEGKIGGAKALISRRSLCSIRQPLSVDLPGLASFGECRHEQLLAGDALQVSSVLRKVLENSKGEVALLVRGHADNQDPRACGQTNDWLSERRAVTVQKHMQVLLKENDRNSITVASEGVGSKEPLDCRDFDREWCYARNRRVELSIDIEALRFKGCPR